MCVHIYEMYEGHLETIAQIVELELTSRALCVAFACALAASSNLPPLVISTEVKFCSS